MNFVNVFIVVPVTAVPYIIIRTLFDFIKPFFCNCINIGSVNTGQELDRFIPERAGCDNTTSILCCCNCLFYFIRRLLIRPQNRSREASVSFYPRCTHRRARCISFHQNHKYFRPWQTAASEIHPHLTPVHRGNLSAYITG